MGETDLNRFKLLRNQLVIAAKNFGREEIVSAVLIPAMSKYLDEQCKLAHKVIDVVDQANRITCVTLLRYKVEKPESSNSQVQIFAKKKEEEKFQQIAYVKYKLEELVYLLDVMGSIYDKVITNKLICNVL